MGSFMSLTPEQYGILGIVIVLVLKELGKIILVLIDKLSGKNGKDDAKKVKADLVLAQMSERLYAQTAVLHQISNTLVAHDNRFREFVSDFKEHERDMRTPHIHKAEY